MSMGANVGPAMAGRVAPALAESVPNAQRIPDGHEYETAYPAAAALERRCLTALGVRLRGLATVLCGPRSDRWFRAAIEGESDRYFRLADLCRLATSLRGDARDAVLDVITELATTLGYRLVPMEGRAADAHAALAGLMETSNGFAVKGVTALSDGKLEPQEARDLRPGLEEIKRGVAVWEGILSAASKGGDE